MKQLIIGVLAFFLAVPMWSQSEKTSLINNIKKENNLYLYGDVTLSSLDVAYEVALQELQANLAEWASNHSRRAVERTQITDLSVLADTIVTKRYNMYRVFAYVHKAKVMEVLNKNGFKIHDNLVTQDDPYNKNLLNRKKDLAQQPIPEEKPLETDKATPEPILKDTLSTPGNQKAAPKVSEAAPKDTVQANPSDKLEEIFPKSKKSGSKKADKDLKQKKAPNSTSDKQKKWQEEVTKSPIKMQKTEKESEPLLDTYQKELERILSARDFFDLEGIMTPMKKSGQITEMGRYTHGTDVSDCYLVIYDTNGNIRALLSPGKDHRMNIGTHTTDHTSNYKNCGAIWFKLK